MKKEIYDKITEKKEFSNLRKIDVELAFRKFDKKEYSDLEKIKLTRDLLRKVFSAFVSRKLLSPKSKNPEWFLKKHLSTRERFNFYEKLYPRLLKNYKEVSIIDLGSGINGLSYPFFKNVSVNYTAVDSVGQFIGLMNSYFKKENLNGKAFHLSLFELDEIKKLIQKTKKPRIIFLFKTLDSLEMIERNYSKKILSEILPLVDMIVLSFATRSMNKGTKFKVQRNWILNFIKENYRILDDFEMGNERYIILKKK
jgi:hypothetical protein